MEQERAELFAEPEVAVPVAAERLDVEVGAGQEALVRVLVDDRERHLAVRVAERDEPSDLHVAGAAAGRLQVEPDAVDAEQEVGRVLLRAVAVVGHRPQAAVRSLDQRADALHGWPGNGGTRPLKGPGPMNAPEGGPAA
jgi:hypothetical protein